MLNQKIGSFIVTLRKERGLTQEQLAEKLGVSNRSVSRWENGNTLPDHSLLQALSAVLDVRMAELLAGRYLPENTRVEDSVRLALELAQQEKDMLRRSLNRLFGAGLTLMLGAILFKDHTRAPQAFLALCSILAAACFLWDFGRIIKKSPPFQVGS